MVGGVHALADELFRAREADSALVCEKLAYSSYAAAAEVVDIVNHAFALLEAAEVLCAFDNIFACQNARIQRRVQTELLVDLKAADPAQIVALGVFERAAD